MSQRRFETTIQEDLLAALVAAAKDHLNADISFLAEIQGDTQITRRRAYSGDLCPLEVDGRVPFKDTYCHRLIHNEIPHVVNCARENAVVKDLAVTRALNIGGYIGVPVTLPDGTLYGSLCCVTHSRSNLGERDVRFLSVLASVIGTHVAKEQEHSQQHLAKQRRIERALATNPFTMVYQPIVELATGRIVGAEALARFHEQPVRTPDKWFAEAWEVDLGAELEIRAMELALANLKRMPGMAYLSVNLSPRTLLSDAFISAATSLDFRRVVVEMTEHDIVSDYQSLTTAITELKNRGARFAIDDVGAGYSGLSRILHLHPHILKLDIALISNIHRDTAKQALVSAVATFASRTKVAVVAEGIETQDEMNALKVLGVPFGQGYHFAKPAQLPLRNHAPGFGTSPIEPGCVSATLS